MPLLKSQDTRFTEQPSMYGFSQHHETNNTHPTCAVRSVPTAIVDHYSLEINFTITLTMNVTNGSNLLVSCIANNFNLSSIYGNGNQSDEEYLESVVSQQIEQTFKDATEADDDLIIQLVFCT